MLKFRDFVDASRRQFNRWFNLDIVKVSGQYTLGAHVATVLKKYGVDAIIDVGANEGAFGVLMRGLGYRGKIFSFEPVAGPYEVLARQAQGDPDWHVFNFALGAQEGQAQINVSKFSQFSSLLPASGYGNSWTNMQVEHRQDIVIKTLDGLFNEGVLAGGRNYFLKMDTQGYDVEVFKGAQASLEKVCCMLSELSLIPLYEGMPSYLESLACYNRAGFLASGFYPITRHASLALNEVDCMLVRPEVAGGAHLPGVAAH
jgi:FkbM family methyltransferase